jgi:16S rRNA C967 or C1407 C5-methylase (RsmB/RsmF family)/NOL1/NOP2/fmu family ribosome biogenesis protein
VLNIPPDFLRQTQENSYISQWELFLESLQREAPTSIRLNPAKYSSIYQNLPQVPWCTEGRYLPERPSFTLAPLFWAGAYYVQEASSMFLGCVLQQILPTEPIKILDLCAAPGGKSTQISTAIGEESLLVSNEVIKNRVNILAENLARWGNANYLISQNDPASFQQLADYFDIIVVDAPCSGEGMFRKEANALTEWSSDNVAFCAARQQRILADVLPALKPEGYLIYSTCTYNQAENEENLLWLASQGLQSVRIDLSADTGIVESRTQTEGQTLYGYRFFSHLIQGEGFFLACMQKESDSTQNSYLKKPKSSYEDLPKKHQETVSTWLKDNDRFAVVTDKQSRVFAVPEAYRYDFAYLENRLWLKSYGLEIGELKGKDLIPAHELATNLSLSDGISRLELDLANALHYLRKQDFDLPNNISEGWALTTYQGFGLGWLKVLKNRVNNYYPTHLRIRNL